MLPGRRTPSGALYVVQGTPPAGTPLVGGIAVRPDGTIYVAGMDAPPPPFSPIDLFQSGEQGAWYDPSDLSTMFQDSAGTTPVTADGQPVGKILDKSGHGNHASQATAAKRPLYKTDGTYHWLQFDGVDDSLSTAAIDFTSTDKMSVFSGVRKNIDTTGILVELGNSGGMDGSFYLVVGEDVSSRYSFNSRGVSGASTSIAKITTNYAPDTAVLTGTGNISGDLNTIRRNAVDGTSGTQNLGTGNYLNGGLYIASRAGSSLSLNGNIYSLIVRGALSTTQEITDTETWVNSKCGAY